MSTIETEASLDTIEGGAPGADPAAADPAAPGAAETAAPAAEPAAPGSPIDWNNIDTLNEAAARLQELGYDIQPVQQPEPAPAPEYDPFDQASVERFIAAREQALEQRLVERFAGTEQFVQAQQAERTSALIDGRIETAIAAAELAPEGFETVDQLHGTVDALANSVAAQKMQEAGWRSVQTVAGMVTVDGRGVPIGPAQASRLGEECIGEAVKILADYRQAAGNAAVEAYKASLTRDGSNLLDPPVRGAGVEGAPAYESEADVARRFINSR